MDDLNFEEEIALIKNIRKQLVKALKEDNEKNQYIELAMMSLNELNHYYDES